MSDPVRLDLAEIAAAAARLAGTREPAGLVTALLDLVRAWAAPSAAFAALRDDTAEGGWRLVPGVVSGSVPVGIERTLARLAEDSPEALERGGVVQRGEEIAGVKARDNWAVPFRAGEQSGALFLRGVPRPAAEGLGEALTLATAAAWARLLGSPAERVEALVADVEKAAQRLAAEARRQVEALQASRPAAGTPEGPEATASAPVEPPPAPVDDPRLAALEAEVRALEDEVHRLEEQAERLAVDARAARGEAETLRAEAESARGERDALRDRADTIEPLAAEARDARAESEALRVESEALRVEREALRERVAEANRRAAEAETRATDAEAARDDAARARAEAEALRERAAEADRRAAEAAAAREETARVRADAEALRERAADAETLAGDVRTARAEAARAKTEAEALRADAERLRAELGRATALAEQASAARDEAVALRSEAERLEANRRSTEASEVRARKAEEELAAAQRDLALARARAGHLDEERRQKLEEAEARARAAADQWDAARRALRAASATVRRAAFLPPAVRVSVQEAVGPDEGEGRAAPWTCAVLLDREAVLLEAVAEALERAGVDVRIAGHPEEIALLLRTADAAGVAAVVCDVMAFRSDQNVAGLIRSWDKDRSGLAFYLSFDTESAAEVERARRIPTSIIAGHIPRPLSSARVLETLETLAKRKGRAQP